MPRPCCPLPPTPAGLHTSPTINAIQQPRLGRCRPLPGASQGGGVAGRWLAGRAHPAFRTAGRPPSEALQGIHEYKVWWLLVAGRVRRAEVRGAFQAGYKGVHACSAPPGRDVGREGRQDSRCASAAAHRGAGLQLPPARRPAVNSTGILTPQLQLGSPQIEGENLGGQRARHARVVQGPLVGHSVRGAVAARPGGCAGGASGCRC